MPAKTADRGRLILSRRRESLRESEFLVLAVLFCCFGATGCKPTADSVSPATPAAPVATTSVPGGTIVVPTNLPPEQQAQIRAQEQADIERNKEHGVPPSGSPR